MKRYKRKFLVTIGTRATYVHTETAEQAITRAVEKLYGDSCFWFANSGMPGYGQVFEALRATKNNSNPGNSSQTSMVGITVEVIGQPSKKFLAQQKQDRIDEAEANETARDFQEKMYNAYIDGRTGKPMPAESWLQSDWHDGVIDQRHEEERISN